MKPARLFATAFLATVTVCSLILLARRHHTRANDLRVRQALARADTELSGGADRDGRLRANGAARSQVDSVFSGVNDYLWAETEQLRGRKDVPVPVDEKIQKIVFGVIGTLRKPEWDLTDPQGRIVDARQKPEEKAELAEGALVSVSRPAAGTWTLHVTADDHVFIFARAASAAGFDACDLRPDGRVDIQISADAVSEAQFRIFSAEGLPKSPWAPAPPLSVSASGVPGRQQYRYRIDAPKIGPFRVGVRMKEGEGPFLQRVCDSLISDGKIHVDTNFPSI